MNPFNLRALRCDCGSTAVVCIDPGSDGERETLFDLALRRPVPARGWCMECFAGFSALLPHEAARKRRGANKERAYLA